MASEPRRARMPRAGDEAGIGDHRDPVSRPVRPRPRLYPFACRVARGARAIRRMQTEKENTQLTPDRAADFVSAVSGEVSRCLLYQ